jgi:hypothetical protein
MVVRSQCAALMTLNPLAQADFIKCFEVEKAAPFAQVDRERFLNRAIIWGPISRAEGFFASRRFW